MILAEKNIYIWDGNYYALEMTKRLSLEYSDGMVRVGPVHYNQVPGFWVRSPRTLGNSGGDQALWGGAGEDFWRRFLIRRFRCIDVTGEARLLLIDFWPIL
jgi:hypothetical protein